MRKLISYMFTSLDGFIADRNGELEWAPIDDELMASPTSTSEAKTANVVRGSRAGGAA